MLPIKLNGTPYQFPTEVSEVTLGQFLQLRKAKDVLDEICALTGMDRQTIQNFKTRTDLDRCQLLLGNLGAKLRQGLAGDKLPRQTTIAGKEVKVPKNLKLEPVGAFIAVHNLINDEQKRCAEAETEFDATSLIPQVLANYFWLHYMGDGALYSDESIDDEQYMDSILTMPVNHALPIANFFFRKYPNW